MLSPETLVGAWAASLTTRGDRCSRRTPGSGSGSGPRRPLYPGRDRMPAAGALTGAMLAQRWAVEETPRPGRLVWDAYRYLCCSEFGSRARAPQAGPVATGGTPTPHAGEATPARYQLSCHARVRVWGSLQRGYRTGLPPAHTRETWSRASPAAAMLLGHLLRRGELPSRHRCR